MMSSSSIGIVGAGIAGLHLALLLQRHGMSTTVYTDQTGEQLRTGRLLNNVCRWGRARDRERELDVDHWAVPDFQMRCAHVHVHTNPPLAFRGDLSHPGSFVDFRIYLPHLMSVYQSRGGELIVRRLDGDDLTAVAARHSLLVVSTGGKVPGRLFPIDQARSAQTPRRLLFAGLFDGVKQPYPVGLHFDIIPGVGEIFQSPVLSLAGRVCGITFEAVPTGPWAPVLGQDCSDSDTCREIVLSLLAECGSEIHTRIDQSRFRLTHDRDLLQGKIIPTMRRPWAWITESRCAVAVGDAAVLNDPVTGQGANLAVTGAWALGEAILGADAFDSGFCQGWERRIQELAEPVVRWTAAALEPPAEHVMTTLRAAAEHQAVADAYLDIFDDPVAMWDVVATPCGADAFIADARSAVRTSRIGS
jgi:hypothetical protein